MNWKTFWKILQIITITIFLVAIINLSLFLYETRERRGMILSSDEDTVEILTDENEVVSLRYEGNKIFIPKLRVVFSSYRDRLIYIHYENENFSLKGY